MPNVNLINKVEMNNLSFSDQQVEIAELAESIAQEYFPTSKIAPEQIASIKNITISYGHYENAFDGLIEHKSGRFHIYCNLDRLEQPTRPRARFTLAHELGHYFIDQHRLALVSGQVPSPLCFSEYESKNIVEQEADCFASNLLMPAQRFMHSAKNKKTGLLGILELVDEFGTSVTSTAVRYAILEIKPCLIIKWSSNGYQWKWLSTKVHSANYKKTIESHSAIIPNSPTAKALAGEQLPSKGIFESATTASAWFPFVHEGSLRDIILIEQALPLGRFGVLTVLFPESGDFPIREH
jgi:Zn-dependent peptidase ImmA (M78 family)